MQHRTWMALAIFLAAALPAVSAPVRKSYADRSNGISFTYPGNWLLNGDDDAATAKLRLVPSSQAGAVVALEGNFSDDEGPYTNTDFEAGAFAYQVQPHASQDECFAALSRVGDQQHQPVVAMVNGLPARRLETSFSVAGTGDQHHMMAIFGRNRCYLLEQVIVSRNSSEAEKPLSPAAWERLRTEFDSVLRSVRIQTAASTK